MVLKRTTRHSIRVHVQSPLTQALRRLSGLLDEIRKELQDGLTGARRIVGRVEHPQPVTEMMEV